jgi:hydrogenase maturation protease
MDPRTVLRFVKAVGGWPGRVIVVACEPAQVDEMRIGLSEHVADAVDKAIEVVEQQLAELAAAPR